MGAQASTLKAQIVGNGDRPLQKQPSDASELSGSNWKPKGRFGLKGKEKERHGSNATTSSANSSSSNNFVSTSVSQPAQQLSLGEGGREGKQRPESTQDRPEPQQRTAAAAGVEGVAGGKKRPMPMPETVSLISSNQI